MKLHVVSFQVPYPADYGGAIDVYYKLKALKEAGYEIVLHTYAYGDRIHQDVPADVYDQIYYYQRETGWKRQFSLLPYIVSTRRDEELLHRLCQDDAPILFEGLHTCYPLDHPLLKHRKKIVRMHNIEHEYYWRLACQTGLNWRTLYYAIEALRLRLFERKLHHAQLICAITKADAQKLSRKYGSASVVHLPCFFDLSFPPSSVETNRFVLYQGNLAIEENHRAALFIIRQIAPRCPDTLFVIAGRNPHLGNVPRNVEVVENPTDEHLDLLLRTARIHLMLTFQPTGIKLKLLNALVKGQGHIIANHDMLYGHSLGQLCIRADRPAEIADKIHRFIDQEPEASELEKRRKTLQKIKKAGISRLSLFQ